MWIEFDRYGPHLSYEGFYSHRSDLLYDIARDNWISNISLNTKSFIHKEIG